MWDEEINKKIKDAADQYHPAYDDGAWDKMEQMLDEHLPLKKDRRRIFYILPLVLLLTGGLFFMIFQKEIIPSSSSSKILPKEKIEKSAPEKQNAASDPVEANSSPAAPAKKSITNVKDKNDLLKGASINIADNTTKKVATIYPHSNGTAVNGTTDITGNNILPASEKLSARNQQKQGKDKDGPLSIKVNSNGNSSEITNANEPVGHAGKSSTTTDETVDQTGKSTNETMVSAAGTGNDGPVGKVNAANSIKDQKEPVKANDLAKTTKPKAPAKNAKQKKTFLQSFGIDVSIGPDISAVRLSETGKITPTYGAGLSYSFNNKFTLRTGFYVAKKIYSVGEDEYHLQPGSTNSAYLASVSANCKVYEIPLTLSYNFSKVKNHNWFASAGLSSYLMKKESYVYFYKYPWGNNTQVPWSVANENKHYFSVLDISGGYAYSLNKHFSLIAEPYIKLPLSGIGAGKIKLNSAGVLFTVAVNPF